MRIGRTPWTYPPAPFARRGSPRRHAFCDGVPDCNDPKDDGIGNYGEPYVVPLGDDAVAIVLDTGDVSSLAYDPQREESRIYNRQVQEGFALAAPWAHSLFINHQPILAYNSDGSSHAGQAQPGVEELQGVLGWIYGEQLFPGAVDAILNGHVHEAQITSFSTGQPPSFVAGHGGTKLITPFSLPLVPATPYPLATLQGFMQSATWGFATMERTGTGWLVTYYGQDGGVLTACSTVNRVVTCTKWPTSAQ